MGMGVGRGGMEGSGGNECGSGFGFMKWENDDCEQEEKEGFGI